MQLGDWLESIGLGQYCERFAEQAIDDLSLLGRLSEGDFDRLGVLVGHRHRLLAAIEALGSVREPAPAPPSGERRQVTIAMCDLVDSTGLSARLDPEDLHSVMSAYDRCVVDTIGRFGGAVVERRGDSALACFGYPTAHEDDPVQATLAALALVDAVAQLQVGTTPPLQARVGIATGVVVVGQPGSAPVVGETPNLAARLQTLAEPGCVVACGRSRELAMGHFEYLDLGSRVLKGYEQPLRSWRVVRSRGDVPSPFAARHEAMLAPLLGREEELDVLTRRWRQTAAGEGRVVLLTGEPGIGKSHLALAFEQTLDAASMHSLHYQCAESHRNSALFPLVARIERDAGLGRGDPPAAKRRKLQTLFGEDPRRIELLADLLGLPREQSDRAESTPQQRKSQTFEALHGHIDALAARCPLLVLFEDVHWIDPTTLEFLTELVERAERHRVFVLVTARREFAAPWASHAHVTTLSIGRLHRRDGAQLVRHVAAGKTLPDGVMDDILSRTDGVPLFVEELTKAVLEAGGLEELSDRFVGHLPAREIPTTLRASLAARLDRLGSAKEIAQVGAVAGRDFAYELVRAVSGWPADRLTAALERLVQAELVQQRGEVPSAVFAFKHVLVRDAAIATLLKTRLTELHATMAAALERLFPDLVALQPERVADHWWEAGQPQRTLPYYLQAGRAAAQRWANVEAIAHLQRGIAALRRLPGAPGTERAELDFLMALAPCLIATRGPAAPDALDVFTRAQALSEQLNAPEYPQATFWVVTASVVRGELEPALQGTVAVQRDAQARGDVAALINADRGGAMIMMFMGRVAQAHDQMLRSLERFDCATDAQKLATRAAGQDAGAAALAKLAWICWLRGDVETAVLRIAQAQQRADEAQHPHTHAYVAYYASILHALRGEPLLAGDCARRCLTLSQEHGFRQWLGLSRAVAGLCDAAAGSASLDDVAQALADYRASGYQLGVTVLYVLLGQTLLGAERFDAAENAATEGLRIAQRTSECFVEAELCRLRAQAMAGQGGPSQRAESMHWYERAVAVARAQGSAWQALRAAIDLAGQLVDAGANEKAVSLLTPIVAGIHEGRASDEYARAAALLRAAAKQRAAR
jgi:class 3 adenylate cyclase/tetratricopeptide (TPR) repeat protein